MASREFIGLSKPAKTRHNDPGDLLSFFIKDAFKLRTLVLFGAAGQIALFAALPFRVAMLPAALLALYSLITTAFQTSNPLYNAYMDGVLVGRTSAQLPSKETGRFGYEPAVHPIVVFHFGVRINHPLGLFSPGAKTTIDHFTACNSLIMERADEYGMLGLSPWRAAERGSHNTLMMMYYFRDVESLNRFAHDDVHRKAWDYLAKGPKHIGFFHEAFCVPPKAYESIYGNFPPFLMGAASVRCVDETGDDTWIRPVVSADAGPLRSQFGRMGRAFKETLDDA
ncbi:hypothetical protein LTR56_004461 [Elasticomyces elasticus]|nr:hypothetical protein LTR22_016877 [Elasticomyces elasticus]KAK3653607.1 hypothetical protein LTR56_004461 [Elasticomyces elasticus]KAK4916492.1 hypothetical protein LTR49_015460 [Elasticomyces elasticus]KAK5755748.1 hypothetical protein LTS12_014101 [Elasticomyces elasticus]